MVFTNKTAYSADGQFQLSDLELNHQDLNQIKENKLNQIKILALFREIFVHFWVSKISQNLSFENFFSSNAALLVSTFRACLP